MRKLKMIRDAIHGNVEVDEGALALLDSPELQRLRYVRQLSFAYLVYPSATHTRFEHSLGAYHLTRELTQRLGFDADRVRALSWAALLHDVGHAVFSHTSEPVLREHGQPPHEELGIRLVRESRLGERVEAHGHSVREITGFMQGKNGGELVSWDFGTDRVDYLLRDAYFTGVAYSIIDAERLLQTIARRNGRLALQEKGLTAAESLVVSRHFMFQTVYQHAALRIAEEMACNALRLGLANGDVKLDDVRRGTDEAVLRQLKDAGNPLADRLLGRRLFKKALVVDAGKTQDWPRVGKRLTHALEDAGLGVEDVAVCLPVAHDKPVTARVQRNGYLVPLASASPLVRALSQAQRLKLIVAARPEAKTKAERVARAVLQRGL